MSLTADQVARLANWTAAHMPGATRQEVMWEALDELLARSPRVGPPLYDLDPSNCQTDAQVAFAAAGASDETIRATLDGAHARNPLRR
jgi:hypothetical protein